MYGHFVILIVCNLCAYVDTRDYSTFFFFLGMFCFLICCVKVDRLEIQEPSGFLGAKVLRAILILSLYLHLSFSSGLCLHLSRTIANKRLHYIHIVLLIANNQYNSLNEIKNEIVH